jgi:threonine synthase
LDHVEGVEAGPTIAGGIKIGRPPRGDLILKALKESGGTALAVDDGDILNQQELLAKEEGIFAETTSCAALSGLQSLLETGIIEGDDMIVIPLTGFGLKDQGATQRRDSTKG